jgi:micrococcal nuclease
MMTRIVAFALALSIAIGVTAWGQTIVVDPACDLEGRCTRVVDGDTLQLRGGETVRLLGIDTPEIGEPFARDAKLFTLQLVAHTALRLEFDEQLRDSYGRLLAFVYAETDEGWVLVNAELVRAGLAWLLFIPPNELHRDLLEEARHEAILARRGLWGTVGGILTVAQLEEDLVTCVTEVVTVRFELDAVTCDDGEILLYAADSDYGFHIRIPESLVPDTGAEDAASWVGSCFTVTGTLDCEYDTGPFIELEIPEQLIHSCSPEADGL